MCRITTPSYRRELDMDSAIARVTYESGGIHYTREVFASYPDQVLLMRITADRLGSVSLAARLASIHASARSNLQSGSAIVMTERWKQ